MALPKLNTQTFELEMPSTDEKIKYRPFLVKEEKILLQAQEGESKEMIDALTTIISNCTFGKVAAEKMPAFDIEYVFLKIRSKSVGEKITLNVLCPDDNTTKVATTVDLSKVEVEVGDKHTNKIDLTDDVSVIMKYPTIKTFIGKDLKKLSAVDIISMTGDCIHQIIDGVETFEVNDLSGKEIDEFLENLTQAQFLKIQTFFTTMPRLKHIVNVTNPKTKKKGKVTLEGMQSFF
jgi:hypothetical protein